MGHYAGEELTPIANTWNNIAYFPSLKFHYKVFDVMIKPIYSNKMRFLNIYFYHALLSPLWGENNTLYSARCVKIVHRQG